MREAIEGASVQSFSAKDMVLQYGMNLPTAEIILELVPVSDKYIDDGSLCTLP